MKNSYTIIKEEKNKYKFVKKSKNNEYKNKGDITRTSYGIYGGTDNSGGSIMEGICFPDVSDCGYFFSYNSERDGKNVIVRPSEVYKSEIALPPRVNENSIIMDTSKVKNFYRFLKYNSDKLREFTPEIDYSSAENMAQAFYGLEALEKLHTINSKKCKYFGETFRGCKKISTVDIDTSSGINFYEMFYDCDNLTNIELDMSKANQLEGMFTNCKNLKKVEFKNFCKDTNINPNYSYLFYGCSSLPTIDLKGIKSSIYSYLFNGCNSLKTIKNLDMSGKTLSYISGSIEYSKTFDKCYKLEDLDIHNIYCRLYLNDSPNLSNESLLQIAKELIVPYEIRDDVPAWEIALYLNDNDRIKDYLNNTYCKVIENDKKKVPIEVVESNENNAISLYDYITEVKKWKVKYKTSS